MLCFAQVTIFIMTLFIYIKIIYNNGNMRVMLFYVESYIKET